MPQDNEQEHTPFTMRGDFPEEFLQSIGLEKVTSVPLFTGKIGGIQPGRTSSIDLLLRAQDKARAEINENLKKPGIL